ncbi:hypothetical protein G5V58_22415 [Nocardioides anomalus]|uniref:Uncharacterized protein n=1 Tax=Nocardioides anomalus TaxID=2712223 RepID=A0A6G6WIU8_9ACTN|nr:hypothetical protein [Nocardioides anomalus]QIG45149.1 hypothetical protein G5V58_22415 [Nocardioides anomalus]
MDAAGGTISAGEAPGGWQVVVSAASAAALGAWKVFVTCSATSDVVADAVGTASMVTAFTVSCPSGQRAVGGGFIGDESSLVARSGPIGAAPDQFGTSPDGTVPTRWRIDLAQPAVGGAVVLCSASADATLRGAALSTPGNGTTAGVATAT